MRFISIILFLIAVLAPASRAAETAQKQVLTIDGARQAITAAVTEAKRLNTNGVFAVVDDGGNLMALERLDGTFAAGANISIGKARTAALFRKPTKFFEDVIAKGRTAMTALPDFTPLQGGVPIIVDGQVVGAIGVSGASSAQQDEELAIIGANAVGSNAATTSAMSAAPTFIESADVSAAFAKGMPLIEKGSFKVHASRREQSGQAEVHTDETDIIYVLEGSATFITGGAVVEAKSTAADEIRGSRIDGGETRTIVRGDVIIVPAGTPHWFKEISGPVLYYVVKVSS